MSYHKRLAVFPLLIAVFARAACGQKTAEEKAAEDPAAQAQLEAARKEQEVATGSPVAV